MDQVIQQYLDWDSARPYLGDLARGFWVTIQIALLAEVIALALGLFLAVLRRAGWVRFLAIAYINFFRAVPALLVLIIMYVSFPFLPIPVVEDLTGFQIGFIGLGLVYAAYIAEVYRAGIESVDRGQTEAARSLGMSNGQTMRLVIVPQAVRRVLPPLMNDFIALTKDVALVSVIAVQDVVGVARDAQAVTFNSTTLTVAVVFYLVFTLPLIWILDRDHRPRAAPRRARRDRRAVSSIRAVGLVKRYGDHTVLRGVDLNVAQGEVVCVIGPSGSGKSTLLRCLNLLERPTEGKVFLGDDEITAPGASVDRMRSRLGMVFQSFNLFPHRTVLDNLTMAPVSVRGVGQEEARARARDAARPRGPRRQGRRAPGAPVRGPAAAGRDRPRPGHGPRGDALRRGHERPRPGAGHRRARRDARARRGRHDDDRRDPRDGVRARGVRPPAVHGRGGDRGGGPPRGGARGPEGGAHEALPVQSPGRLGGEGEQVLQRGRLEA